MLGWAGLYTPRISGWSGSIGVLNSDWPTIWDAVGTRRSEDAPTGALLFDLLVPGRFPGSDEFSLAADLGRVAALEPGRAEFLLGGDPSWVAGPATRDAALLLAESPGCFPLRRRGRSRLGSLREASCGGVFSEGEGEARSPGHRAGGVTGSGT